jgi:hypothetical protein
VGPKPGCRGWELWDPRLPCLARGVCLNWGRGGAAPDVWHRDVTRLLQSRKKVPAAPARSRAECFQVFYSVALGEKGSPEAGWGPELQGSRAALTGMRERCGPGTVVKRSHMLMSVAIQLARNLGTNQCAEPDRWTDTWKSETLTALLEPSGSGGSIYEGARQAKASRYQDGRLFVFKLASGQVRCPPLGPAHTCPDNIGSREGLAAACSFAQPSQRG